MKTAAVALLGIWGMVLAAPAQAQSLTLEEVNKADLSAQKESGISPTMIKAQVLLDRARFSPGVIDGYQGENLQNAIEAFEKENNLQADGKLDEELWSKLTGTSSDPVLKEYTITEDDVNGPFVDEIPDKLKAQADLERLSYTSARELLAEKFHMDADLLKALNPDKSFDKAGTTILVANVTTDGSDQAKKVKKIEVLKSERALRALAEDGSLIAVYPATIGSEEKPAPDGTHKVEAIAKNPTYTYNPEYSFEGVDSKEKFVVAPGPNNPVGSVWIDLSIESYGIHGTPEPAKVGKTYSHGCVRLTNWDAEELAEMVEKGTEVTFLD
ncbi:L,D-transpeptidase family protein [Microvirga sp. GCM10011540]|uniref:L,D-transpeptidase family protein n=1 Tax=Microvirga sp. GCM10011540 TaxID=3317338 RepID=UPI00360D0ED8